MSTRDDGWHFEEGDLLAPGLAALRRLGGGAAYEAWLCFDEVTWSPVVVKVLRPSQLDDESSRRGLRREVLALATVPLLTDGDHVLYRPVNAARPSWA